MTVINKATGKPVTFAESNETPVIPPSMKLFGSKNPFNPRPADKIPNDTNVKSFKNLSGLIFRLFHF